MNRLMIGVILLGWVAQADAGQPKTIAIGAGGVPYVVGGTVEENWRLQMRQHLADQDLISEHDWPELPNLGDRFTQPGSFAPMIVIGMPG